jgi:hypothetical protein
MDPQGKFYFRVADEVRGPATVEQLRDFASVTVITPETEIAASAAGPWARIATVAIHAEVFPARRVIEFKAAEFESINDESTPAVRVDDLKEAALRPPPSLRGREVIVAPGVARPARDGDPANEVQAMVLEVGRRVAANTPVVVLPPTPGPFPRWPWFAVPAVLGSAGIMCIPMLYEWRYDEMSVSILIGWTVLFNAMLVGVMVLDQQHNRNVGANKTTPATRR